ncbi:collagen alpha-1(XII) chain-like [Dreissena polymorpha]|nr:collagen alpha-1(XII) chain-like [Dreissena polymorpha]
MVDSSSYVGVANFRYQLNFIKNNIRYYNLSPQCTHISVVTYSSGVYNQFYLNQYHTLQELNRAIDGIQYQAGGSNTADAINWVYQNSFTAAHGGRTGAPHYAIWVGGSTSANPSQTVTAAETARNNGMSIFAVGVGNGYNSGELRGMTNSDKNMFTSQNFNALSTLAEPLAIRVNGAVTPSTNQGMGAPNSCLQRADIAFLIDGSGSIGSANFLKLENFVKGIVGKLDVAPDKTHVGVVQFSNYPKQEFPLNMYTSRQDVMTGIDSMHYMGGGTNTADGLKYLREHTITSTAGASPNVPRIAIVITDGQSANPTATAAEADKARQDHIGLLAVGVGNGVSLNELNAIADNPDSANTFTVNSYDQLDSIAAQIIQRACTVQATAPPPTSASSVTHPPDPCQNKLPDCAKYDKSVCSGTYFGWARDNCPRYCGFCVPLYTEPPPPCVDSLSNCHLFPPSSCVGNFTAWAKDNCRKYCGYCDASSQSV